ncbi:DUF6093 family protein [Micromonospora sp. NPDC020750]|uniref:DUF6093 family protein n=1 Tax=unclassified Micromonospora TaxID=2617518 RepID=UPI0037B8BC2E
MPLPNYRLIHPRFEQHHRPVSEAAMTVSGRLLRPSETGVRNPETGKTTFPAPALIYVGRARVRANSGAQSVQADRIVAVGGYLLILPADSPVPHVRDVWETDECDGDPSLVGARLRVVNVPRNGLSWQRNVGCDIEEPINRRG